VPEGHVARPVVRHDGALDFDVPLKHPNESGHERAFELGPDDILGVVADHLAQVGIFEGFLIHPVKTQKSSRENVVPWRSLKEETISDSDRSSSSV